MRGTNKQETGAALLSVLLLVAFMSIAALALMDVSVRGIQNAKASDGQSRALWQITGAEQAALLRIERIFEATNGELGKSGAGLGEEITVSTDNLVVTARLEEAGNCFNLSALVSSELDPDDGFDDSDDQDEFFGGDDEDELQAQTGALVSSADNYRQLLGLAGLREDEVERATNALLDWTDADNITRTGGAEDAHYRLLKPPYLTSGTQLAELSELRAIRGYNKKIIDQISPLLCARLEKEMSTLNINTLRPDQAALLSMVFAGELTPREARDLLANRPEDGWASVDEMFQERRIERIDPEDRQSNLLSTRSRYVRLEGRVSGGRQDIAFSSLYFVADDFRARLVSRKTGGV